MEARSQLRHRPTKDYLILMEQARSVNESGAHPMALSCSKFGASGTPWQPPVRIRHRRGHMLLTRTSIALLLGSLSWSLSAQSAVPSNQANSVSSTVRPALTQVGDTLGSISIHRWKAPSEVKSAADQDVSSIQRDLAGTLSGLLQQADAAPGSVPAAFAVYRNVDALYDTLLRVVLTANLAAPDNEVNSLQGALSSLENARAALGESILNTSQAQQSELIRVRTALANAAAARSTPATTTVVDDGPAKDTAAKRKHTTSTKKTTSGSGTTTPE